LGITRPCQLKTPIPPWPLEQIQRNFNSYRIVKRGTNSANFCENCARDTTLQGVYIPHFDQISVKNFSFGGSCTLIAAPMGVKFGTEEETFGFLLCTKFHPRRCNVWPLRGEKPQNRPLTNLNTGALRCAQCCLYSGNKMV